MPGARSGLRVVVEADGGSRGNPGPAGYGAVVFDAATGEVLAERSAALGETTNNVAEYEGLIAGLEAATKLGASDVAVRMDSKLVVEQMSGRWKIKHPNLRPLALRARDLAQALPSVSWTWIPREQNTHADRLANEAMDASARDVRADRVDATEASPGPRTGVGPGEQASRGGSGVTRRLSGWMDPHQAPTITLLVRHGATELSVAKRFSGRGDTALSELGRTQAAAVAQRLADWPEVAAVVSSPLSRARETAGAVAAATGKPLSFDADLAETDFGEWEGFTFAEVGERWPRELADWLASDDVAPPGGESFAQTYRRVRQARDRIITSYAGRTVVVVSHVTPVKSLVRMALHAPHEAVFRMHVDLVSLTEVDWHQDGPAVLRRFNDTAHYTPTYGH